MFAEKSLSNGELAPLLADLFPRAKFVCLYRHPMDFIASAVDSCRWGYSAFGLFPYAAGSVENFVAGLARAWSERTASILEFEANFPKRCIRICYEDLVTETETTFADICKFLGVNFEKAAIGNAFLQRHLGGHGDHQIGLYSTTSTDSIGRGSQVPVRSIPPIGLAQINRQLLLLGYPAIDYEWNHRPSPLRAGLGTNESRTRISRLLCESLPRGLALATKGSRIGEQSGLIVVVDEFAEEICWVIDYSTLQVTSEPALPVAPCRPPGLVEADPDRTDNGENEAHQGSDSTAVLRENGAEARSPAAESPTPVLFLRAIVLEGIASGITDPGEALERGDLRISTTSESPGRSVNLRLLFDALAALRAA